LGNFTLTTNVHFSGINFRIIFFWNSFLCSNGHP
jgi:hypothetical protein